MAKKKISGLPAGSALNGTELVPIVQTGTTKRITTQDIANLGNASGVEGTGTINKLAKFTASSTIGNSQLFDDGTSVGLGTITPLGLLHLFKTAATTRLVMDGNAAQNRVISYRTNAVQRFGLYVNNTAESGANAGSDFAIRAYNDAGTLLSTPLFIKRSTGAATFASSITAGTNITCGTGAFDTGGFFMPYTPSSASSRSWKITNDQISFGDFSIKQSSTQSGTPDVVKFYISAAGNVGIGTTNPTGLAATEGLLHINTNGSANSEIHITNSATGATSTDGSSIIQLGTKLIIANLENDYVSIFANNSEKLRINPNGNTLIGTTTDAGFKLDVNGTANFTGAVAIGNSVAAGVAVASTHKVTMVIGGVTYYLLASDV